MLVIVALIANHGLISLKTFVSRFSTNCAISFFRLYLILHACTARFDVIVWGEIFLELNQALQKENPFKFFLFPTYIYIIH